MQSSSTELGGPQAVGRPSTRLHAPPGGASSISFGNYEPPSSSSGGSSPSRLRAAQELQSSAYAPGPFTNRLIGQVGRRDPNAGSSSSPQRAQQQYTPAPQQQHFSSGGGGDSGRSPTTRRELQEQRKAADLAAAAALYNRQFERPKPVEKPSLANGYAPCVCCFDHPPPPPHPPPPLLLLPLVH
eukprot:COSAG01_NODE_1237_length_11098_cov_7.982726_6_plen_185_part_00